VHKEKMQILIKIVISLIVIVAATLIGKNCHPLQVLLA
jgi:hypothetical protein